jgi:hypothetical protein
MNDLDHLYSLLDAAHSKAESGDPEAAKHAKEIYDHIQTVKLTKQRAEETPPILTGIAGATAGAPVSTGYGVYKTVTNPTVQNVASNLVHGGKNWVKALTGVTPNVPGGSQMDEAALKQAQGMVKTIQPGGELAGGSIYKDSVLVGPDIKAQAAKNIASREAGMGSRFLEGAKNFAGNAGKVYAPVAKFAGPVAGGFQAGYEGMDAINRFNRGDTTGGILSTISGGAGLASMYPPLAPVALPISATASGLGWALDEYRKRKHQPQQGYEQQPAQYATGGLVYLR